MAADPPKLTRTRDGKICAAPSGQVIDLTAQRLTRSHRTSVALLAIVAVLANGSVSAAQRSPTTCNAGARVGADEARALQYSWKVGSSRVVFLLANSTVDKSVTRGAESWSWKLPIAVVGRQKVRSTVVGSHGRFDARQRQGSPRSIVLRDCSRWRPDLTGAPSAMDFSRKPQATVQIEHRYGQTDSIGAHPGAVAESPLTQAGGVHLAGGRRSFGQRRAPITAPRGPVWWLLAFGNFLSEHARTAEAEAVWRAAFAEDHLVGLNLRQQLLHEGRETEARVALGASSRPRRYGRANVSCLDDDKTP